LSPPTISIATGDLAPRDAYRLMVSVVVPRPIAWVSSVGVDGTVNLAPFSFFNGVGDTPPTIMVSIGQRRTGAEKDTLRNLRATGEFVVNIVDRALAEQMNLTSGEWPYEVDEFKLAALASEPSVDVRPPRVAAAPVALEAIVTQMIPVDNTHYTIVLGRVVRYHIREGLIGSDGLVVATLLNPLARLGGDDYTDVDHAFSMKRPG
jgi:flavin reductase (DIM6/NTAB) family NADH-FMN oxidoreductase RutF